MTEKKKKFAEPRRGRSISKIEWGRSGFRLCCAPYRLYTTSGISFDFGRGEVYRWPLRLWVILVESSLK